MHHGLRQIDACDQGKKFVTQLGCRAKAAIGIQVVAEKPVARPRDMATNRIKRFVLAAKAIRNTGVNQAQFTAFEAGQYLIAADDPVVTLDFKNGRNRLWPLAGQGAPFLDPLPDTAIEQRNTIMPQPAQQPPQARCDHAPIVVIGDDRGLPRNAGNAQFVCQ